MELFEHMTQRAKNWVEESKKLIIKYDILVALICAVAVIMVGIWLGLENNKVIPINPNPQYHYQSPDPLSFLSNWDGPFYIAIAKHGYSTLMTAGFYPLYPLTIRAFFYVFRSYLLSALFVSWAGLVGAIYFYIKVVRQLGLIREESTRYMSVLPFILFPTGVFLIATYTEGLFTALALGSIYFSLRRRYVWASLFLLLATTAHITGVFLIIMDALILWEEKLPIKKIATVVAAGACGAVAYMVYLLLRFHDALAFLDSQTVVHGWFESSYSHLVSSMSFLNILFSVLLILSALFYWRTRKSFAIYSLLFLLIPIVGMQWGGFNRYVLTAFPIPLMIYEFLRDKWRLYMMVVMLSAILWAYILLQYAVGYIGS